MQIQEICEDHKVKIKVRNVFLEKRNCEIFVDSVAH